MADSDKTSRCAGADPSPQPTALSAFLAAANSARRLASMYGSEHPHTVAAIARAEVCAEEFMSAYSRATCVFTYSAAIVNQHYYSPSNDSLEICERLRARGAMAVTFIGTPEIEHIRELLLFMNTEPREVREQGGPSDFLRKRGVTRVVLTESIYSSGEDEDNAQPETSQWSEADQDVVIAAAINWLTRQEEDADPPPPRLPIARIMTSPDAAAKLIREAVTKLHASRRDLSNGERVAEAINDLKTVASDAPEEWDKAAPQIRRAISKLPENLMPASSRLFPRNSADSRSSGENSARSTVEEAEEFVAALLRASHQGEEVSALPSPSVFEPYFGAQPPGLLSSWKRELQPKSVLESTGRTLEVLLSWENNAVEHGRIADALAVIISRAIEVNDTSSALRCLESLLNQALVDTENGWRTSNVKGALERLGNDVLSAVCRLALETHRARAEEATGQLLALMPGLSIQMLQLLGTKQGRVLLPHLKTAVAALGRLAQPAVSRILNEGSCDAKSDALELLLATDEPWAADAVLRTIRTAEPGFIATALRTISRFRTSAVTEECLQLVSHSDYAVRAAAIIALGELGDPNAVPRLARLITNSGLIGGCTKEQLLTVDALARIGSPDAVECLKTLARRRPILGRSRFESLRQTAQTALMRLGNSQIASRAA